MEFNAGVRMQNKKILVIGKLGYHEDTIIKPILNQFDKLGIIYDRLGENADFFIPGNKNNMINNWLSGIPQKMSEYDVLFFTDYWNMSIPLFMYKRYAESISPKMVGLFHGSVMLDSGDVAHQIPNSKDYELYLFKAFDKIIIPKKFIYDKYTENIQCKLRICEFPLDYLSSVDRPEFSQKNNIFYAHRSTTDKGVEKFLSFVEKFPNEFTYIMFGVTDVSSDIYNRILKLPIKVHGWVTRDFIKDEIKKYNGGYAWSSVISETVGYAILDLVSYGLTPLLNNHPAYTIFPKKYIYTDDNPLTVIQKSYVFNTDEWNDILKQNKKNAYYIAEEIIS